MTYDEIIVYLNELKDPEKIVFKEKKFGIVAHNSLGIYHKDLKELAKDIGKGRNDLALQLFDSNIYEGRLLCSKLFNTNDVTEELMEKWVKTFENWEICDSFCMGLFAKSKFALAKIIDWTKRKSEFEKRAGFAIMAAYCMADKKSDNELFEQFFPIIKKEANDDRLYVKKAINWALRNIGKRNIDLNKKAIKVANQLLELKSSSAIWIAKNALNELQKENVRISDYPRNIYRTKN
ncbi:DNA alkylation repair protein [Aquimarina sp. AD1]|uniref:DNA alkylation repair protein n=1 Tax=Aquimarina sp. (strain AD1) TaxID=1714848 RepID=UPI000E4C10CA|nr:DNA alkylation repair protein [Aquimarina sp. AD1]AXT54977.1 DNA alkylation repair protein [Aquimarina sp. AD1]RKN20563.1 DNA alkylation repair protein [Aquimarina sp. AD1]